MKTHPLHSVEETQDAPPDAVYADIDGALGMLVDYCTRTAFRPQPFLALGASITAIGALAGRRYASPTGLRSNIYALGLADSGSGKDHARQCILRALMEAGLSRYLGGHRLGSSSGLLTSIEQHPSRLFLLDEMGHMLAAMSGKTAPQHLAAIMSLLTELFTSAGSVVLGTEYAKQDANAKPRIDLYQPHACVYGTTVAATLWKSIRSASLHDGFLARWIVFQSPDDYPDENVSTVMEAPPPALVEALKEIAAGVPNHDPGGNLAGLMDATIPMTPYAVPFDAAAEAARVTLLRRQTERLRGARGTFATSFIARHGEKVARLAMIRAISRAPAAPIVNAGDMAWADTLASYTLATVLREAEANVADNEGEALAKAILRTVTAAGPRGITGAALRRAHRGEPDRRERLIVDLIASGEIAPPVKAGGKGRPAVIYRATGT